MSRVFSHIPGIPPTLAGWLLAALLACVCLPAAPSLCAAAE